MSDFRPSATVTELMTKVRKQRAKVDAHRDAVRHLAEKAKRAVTHAGEVKGVGK